MSADSHSVCPKCHPDLIGRPGVTDNFADDLGYYRGVRENYEYYILDGDKLVSEYSANCWDCDFTFEVKHVDQIPGLT